MKEEVSLVKWHGGQLLGYLSPKNKQANKQKIGSFFFLFFLPPNIKNCKKKRKFAREKHISHQEKHFSFSKIFSKNFTK